MSLVSLEWQREAWLLMHGTALGQEVHLQGGNGVGTGLQHMQGGGLWETQAVMSSRDTCSGSQFSLQGQHPAGSQRTQ